MKTRLSLNKAWEKCIKSWEKIVKAHKEGEGSITELKHKIVPITAHAHCYFCEYDQQQRAGSDKLTVCTKCPLTLAGVKKIRCQLRCNSTEWGYVHQPEKFLRKLKQLDRKRRKNDARRSS